MPNHIHGIIQIDKNNPKYTSGNNDTHDGGETGDGRDAINRVSADDRILPDNRV